MESILTERQDSKEEADGRLLVPQLGYAAKPVWWSRFWKTVRGAWWLTGRSHDQFHVSGIQSIECEDGLVDRSLQMHHPVPCFLDPVR